MNADRRTLPAGHDARTLAEEIRVKAARIDGTPDLDPDGDETELDALRDIRDAALHLAGLLGGPVYVLHYSHRHGDDYSAHATQESAEAWIAGIARQWWADEVAGDAGRPSTPDGLSNAEATRIYFETVGDRSYPESYHIVACPVLTGDTPEGTGGAAGPWRDGGELAELFTAATDDEAAAIEAAAVRAGLLLQCQACGNGTGDAGDLCQACGAELGAASAPDLAGQINANLAATGEGIKRTGPATTKQQRSNAAPSPIPADMIALCDPCYLAASGLLPECQDGCARSLDHQGLCTRERKRYGRGEACQWCGQHDRLTVTDRENLDLASLPTVGDDGSDGAEWWLHWPRERRGPYANPAEAWQTFHDDTETAYYHPHEASQ